MSLSLGTHTHPIPVSLYKDNRNRVAAGLRETKKIKNESSAYIILKGGTEDEYGFYDTDTNQTTFRQVNQLQISIIITHIHLFVGILLPISLRCL